MSITSLFNLAFYPFLYNPSNGLFQTITGILVTGYVFKIVWVLVKNKNT